MNRIIARLMVTVQQVTAARRSKQQAVFLEKCEKTLPKRTVCYIQREIATFLKGVLCSLPFPPRLKIPAGLETNLLPTRYL